MAMRLPITLAALLALWAASETGLCLTPCPSHCTARFGIALPEGPKIVQGTGASLVIKFIERLEKLEPGPDMVYIRIKGGRVKVPRKLKKQVEMMIREHSDISGTVQYILKNYKPKKPLKKPPKGDHRRPHRPGKGGKSVRSPPGKTIVPSYKPEIPVPSPSDQMFIPPGIRGVNDLIRFWLELMLNQPNYFILSHAALLKLGVIFKNLNYPIKEVYVGGVKIPLPRPVTVKYLVHINDQSFHLPRDAGRLAAYVSKHPEQLALVVTLLRQFDSTFSKNNQGQLTAFSLFNNSYSFERPLDIKITVGNKDFELPKDIKLVIDIAKTRPQEILGKLPLLRVYGVKPVETSEGLVELQVPGQGTTKVEIPGSARITLGKRQYSIPADLEKIFRRPGEVHIGMLFRALQRENIKVKVDGSTGVVLGIMIRGILVPLPLTIDLRFRLNDKVYNIPRDLKALIAHLERIGMPSQALHILYTRYGVVPVRNSAGIVIALSFNGKKYPIKVEKQTVVVILKKKFFLPRDANKMISFVGADQKRVVPMLQALQRAGFMFVPETNGYLQTIQKGAQMITLGMRIQVTVRYRGVFYRMPYDLPRLVKVVKGISPKEMKELLRELKKVGVIVTKKGSKLVIQFNSIKYTVNG